MNLVTAFIGDVHGNVVALRRLLEELRSAGVGKAVLLGDYINKGPDASAVLSLLVENDCGVELHALRGNHEEIFLKCLESGDVRPLLRMSGAPTISSYVGARVGPDVHADLYAAVPSRHIEFIRSMPTVYHDDGLVASHRPGAAAGSFRVSAHVPVGLTPRISKEEAEIDTGCGSGKGRLTAFLWPQRDYIQVDEEA